jgi:hypothetical protein
MANVSVNSCITAFCDQRGTVDNVPEAPSAEYLFAREMAERAAAKRSSSQVARAVHQQLAQMYADRRRRIG